MTAKKKQEVQVATAQEIAPGSTDNQAAVVLQTLQKAVEKGADPDTLEKLLSMSERIQDRQAEQDFWRDFHQARAEMPPVNVRGNNDGKKYALLEDIQKQIVPVYSKYGFNMLFSGDVSPIEGHRRMVAKLAHRAGHCEEFNTDMPHDALSQQGKVTKTVIQQSGSTDSYAQRYLTMQVWNLQILKNALDNDGGQVEETPVVISENQAANLHALGDEIGMKVKDWDVFKEFYKINKIDDLPVSKFARAVKALEQRRKK